MHTEKVENISVFSFLEPSHFGKLQGSFFAVGCSPWPFALSDAVSACDSLLPYGETVPLASE